MLALPGSITSHTLKYLACSHREAWKRNPSGEREEVESHKNKILSILSAVISVHSYDEDEMENEKKVSFDRERFLVNLCKA